MLQAMRMQADMTWLFNNNSLVIHSGLVQDSPTDKKKSEDAQIPYTKSYSCIRDLHTMYTSVGRPSETRNVSYDTT